MRFESGFVRVRGEVPFHCTTEDNYSYWSKLQYLFDRFVNTIEIREFSRKKTIFSISCIIMFYVHRAFFWFTPSSLTDIR